MLTFELDLDLQGNDSTQNHLLIHLKVSSRHQTCLETYTNPKMTSNLSPSLKNIKSMNKQIFLILKVQKLVSPTTMLVKFAHQIVSVSCWITNCDVINPAGTSRC